MFYNFILNIQIDNIQQIRTVWQIGQKQSLNELKKRYNEENLKVQLNESTNLIWDEVRKQGNCYMKIQGDIAIIKFVIGEKEIEIPPIQLTDIEKYINTD